MTFLLELLLILHSSNMKTIRRDTRRLFITCLLCLGFGVSCGKGPNSHARSYQVVHTKDDLVDVAHAIKTLTVDMCAPRTNLTRVVFPEDLEPLSLFRVLTQNPIGEPGYLTQTLSYRFWLKEQSIVDRWGNPFNFRTERKALLEEEGRSFEVLQITFWSNGPNGKNDQRTQDDIAGAPFEIQFPRHRD